MTQQLCCLLSSCCCNRCQPKTKDMGLLTWYCLVAIRSQSPTSYGWMTKRKMTASYSWRMELPKMKANASTTEENSNHTFWMSTCRSVGLFDCRWHTS